MTILIHNLESWRDGTMGNTMIKFTLALLFIVAPGLALAAESALSFAPPATDASVVFLGNIFGIVDGVLHGSGSQIMGSMFAVFNAAVLALGGIIIMYTILVSTLNTAHEGEMLGKKWSSLWVPMRATFGLALLIPKASGYCLMQIFIMWVVVQGVGAADKVWNAALGYLNRGGMIIHAQTNPVKNLNQAGPSAQIVHGAEVILAGQVCMQGLQTQLEAVRQDYLVKKQGGGGPCYGDSLSEGMDQFCNFNIPSLSNSVNFLSVQQSQPLVQVNQPYTITMPNFPDASPYAFLNGACGKITWNRFGLSQDVMQKLPTLTDADIATANISRTIAVQQMYLDLGLVASTMISNDPQLGPPPAGGGGAPMPNYSPIAKQPFGMPLTKNQSICADSTTTDCVLWGVPPGSQGAPLLNGTEFQGAISDYNGIMLPTLILIQQAVQSNTAGNSRDFIKSASSQGWLLAGSYFFNLVNLTQQAEALSDQTDSTSGLDGSKFDAATIMGPYAGSSGLLCHPTANPDLSMLCNWLKYEVSPSLPLQNIVNLINGQILGGNPPTGIPDTKGTLTTKQGAVSSTVYGYMINGLIIQTGTQPGTAPLQFANKVHFEFTGNTFQLPSVDFGCGQLKIGIPLIFFTITFSTCFGGALADIFYNHLARPVFNAILEAFSGLINGLIELFIVTPLVGMSTIFKHGLDIISAPGVNPIVALAQMGTFYINFSGQMALDMVDQAIIGILLPPPFDMFVFVLMGAAFPVIMAFMSIFSGIGITTAYYVPLLPYMMFTFGGIAWLTTVIESMVAGPIVGLGVTHPEGEGAFGKGEAAIMILLNVFLRPSLMIIGYIAGIALCYISVWMVNAGFDNAIAFIQGGNEFGSMLQNSVVSTSTGNISGGYTDWAGIFAYFFSILIYTSIYLTVVQKSFSLIALLPDQVLRWIGGAPETSGKEASDWGKDTKGEIEKAGKSTQQGLTQSIAGTTEGAVAAAKWVKGGVTKLASKLVSKGAKGKSTGEEGTPTSASTPSSPTSTAEAGSKAEDALADLAHQQEKDEREAPKPQMSDIDKEQMELDDKKFEDELNNDTTRTEEEKQLARVEHYANQSSNVSSMGFDNSGSLAKLDDALADLEKEVAAESLKGAAGATATTLESANEAIEQNEEAAARAAEEAAKDTGKKSPQEAQAEDIRAKAKAEEKSSEKEEAASAADDEAFEKSLEASSLSDEEKAVKRIAHYSGKAVSAMSMGGEGASAGAQEKLAAAIAARAEARKTASTEAAKPAAVEVEKAKTKDERTISDRAEDTLANLASLEKKAGSADGAEAKPLSGEALASSRAEDKEFEASLKLEKGLSESERQLKRVDYYGAKLARGMGVDGAGAVDPELEKILDGAITKFEAAVEDEKEPSAITRAKARWGALGVDTDKAFKKEYKRTEDKAGTKEYKKSLKDDPTLSDRERRVKGALFNAGLESSADKKGEEQASAAMARLAAAKEKAGKEPGSADGAKSGARAQTKEEIKASEEADEAFEASLDKPWLTDKEKDLKRVEYYADKAEKGLSSGGFVDAGAEKKLEKAMKGLEKAAKADQGVLTDRVKTRNAAWTGKADTSSKTKIDPQALANYKRKLDADPTLSEGEKRLKMALFDPQAEAKKLEKTASSALTGFAEAKKKAEAKEPGSAASGLPAQTEAESEAEDKKFEDGLKDKKWLTPKEKELVRMEYYAEKATRSLGAGGAAAERAEKKLDAVIKSYEGLVKDDKRYDDVLRRAKANFAIAMGKGADTSALDASFKSLKPAMTADQQKARGKFMEALDANPDLSDREKRLKRILYDADIAHMNRMEAQKGKKK